MGRRSRGPADDHRRPTPAALVFKYRCLLLAKHIARQEFLRSVKKLGEFVKMGRRPARCYRYCKNKPFVSPPGGPGAGLEALRSRFRLPLRIVGTKKLTLTGFVLPQ